MCRRRGCDTILSRFNDGHHCFQHSEPHEVQHRVVTTTSDRFIENVPGTYSLTYRERREYRKGQA